MCFVLSKKCGVSPASYSFCRSSRLVRSSSRLGVNSPASYATKRNASEVRTFLEVSSSVTESLKVILFSKPIKEEMS